MIQNKNLFWLSWLTLLLSTVTLLAGILILLKAGQTSGLFYALAGYIGFGVSGLVMALAYGAP